MLKFPEASGKARIEIHEQLIMRIRNNPNVIFFMIGSFLFVGREYT